LVYGPVPPNAWPKLRALLADLDRFGKAHRLTTDMPHVRPKSLEEVDADLQRFGRTSGSTLDTRTKDPIEAVSEEIRRQRLVLGLQFDKADHLAIEALLEFWRKQLPNDPPPHVQKVTCEGEALAVLDLLERGLNQIASGQRADGAPKHRGKRGRPRSPDHPNPKRRQLVEEWKRFKEAGGTRKDFCGDKGIKVPELEKAVDAEAKWEQRRG
jgi:hypothetical protein